MDNTYGETDGEERWRDGWRALENRGSSNFSLLFPLSLIINAGKQKRALEVASGAPRLQPVGRLWPERCGAPDTAVRQAVLGR